MRVLIIHNENLPKGIINLSNENGREVVTYKISQASVSEEDYDTFLSGQVKELTSPSSGDAPFEPDLVVLPYSLSEINPAELTGIRLAAHFRMNDGESCLKRAPVLFLGPLSLEEALRLSPLANFLITPRVFMSELCSADALVDWIGNNTDSIHPLSEKEYSSFVNGFVVDAPSNFNDARHSITNRWTLLRWEEMFEWGDNPPQLASSVRDFANNLYFKWIQAKLGPRAHFKKKHKTPAQISNISGKIVFIDDEIKLGWGDIMGRLIGNSKAEYLAYEDFDNSYSREELLDRIQKYIDSVPDASCYVLDLRLHEEDHSNPDHTAYTGHRVAQHIYAKNRGAQIVFFTASEKTLNYVASEKYFSGYVIKENPSHLYDRDGSKKVFFDFAHALQKACANSYLRDYNGLCKDTPYLDDFFEILRQDDDQDTRSHEINMRSAALNLIVFIETAVRAHFSIDGNSLKKGSETVADIYDACLELKQSTTPKTPIHFGSYPDLMPAGESDTKWGRIFQKVTDIGLICAALHGYCGVGREHIDKVIKLKNIRNSSLAHGGGGLESDTKIEVPFLRTVFDNVVKKMISKGILTQ